MQFRLKKLIHSGTPPKLMYIPKMRTHKSVLYAWPLLHKLDKQSRTHYFFKLSLRCLQKNNPLESIVQLWCLYKHLLTMSACRRRGWGRRWPRCKGRRRGKQGSAASYWKDLFVAQIIIHGGQLCKGHCACAMRCWVMITYASATRGYRVPYRVRWRQQSARRARYHSNTMGKCAESAIIFHQWLRAIKILH